MSGFRQWAKAVFVALALVAFFAFVIAAKSQPAQKEADCIAVSKLSALLTRYPGFSNLRAVKPGKLAFAVDVYNAQPPVSNERWTMAMLVDGPDGAGALLVGRDGMICGYIIIHSPHWKVIVNKIEGAAI